MGSARLMRLWDVVWSRQEHVLMCLVSASLFTGTSWYTAHDYNGKVSGSYMVYRAQHMVITARPTAQRANRFPFSGNTHCHNSALCQTALRPAKSFAKAPLASGLLASTSPESETLE